MKIKRHLIQKAVSRVLSATKPVRIILFGSAASGKTTPDSDIDLLVLEKNIINPREESLRLRKTLNGLGVPVDVFVMSFARYEETKNVIGGIAYTANKYGKPVYETA